MNSSPFISICIPAYKNKDYLKRLFDSISIQQFKDFEVIVSDDSSDNSVERLVQKYSSLFTVLYVKNEKALGSPANWNNAILLARGEWIKIMHDDDWFIGENSLASFARTASVSVSDFIFSGFILADVEKKSEITFLTNCLNKWMLQKNPLYLFRTNYIGHPSTTCIRNKKEKIWFDEKIKWVVDIEFYIRELKLSGFEMIADPLIKIGINPDQITKNVFRNREIEIPENLYLLNIIGEKALRNIYVYDYYWRLLRNLCITSIAELKMFSREEKVPNLIIRMVARQQFFGIDRLKTSGVFSKACMLYSFAIDFFRA